jgi:hypothetical protein
MEHRGGEKEKQNYRVNHIKIHNIYAVEETTICIESHCEGGRGKQLN